jgi:hypothetical protein
MVTFADLLAEVRDFVLRKRRKHREKGDREGGKEEEKEGQAINAH